MTSDGKIKLLFITRKFPPQVGGMETLSWALSKEFPRLSNTQTISWGGSQVYLPFFLAYALFKSLYLIPTKKITNIHLGDALLSPLGLILKKIFGIKVTVTVCGLDITYPLSVYQTVVPWCVSQLDKSICISTATLEECVKRGVSREKCVMIPCGVYPEDYQVHAYRVDAEKILKNNLKHKKVLLTVGRHVKRKGVYWFIKNVFPKLEDNYLYIITGNGPETERIENLIKRLKLVGRIILTGKISDEKLKILYNTLDLFIMPNIRVAGDMEGFGIVVLEAASAGLPVVASDLEGIHDAVVDGKTGILVTPEDSKEYIDAIHDSKKFNKSEVINTIKRNYSWETIAKRYIDQIK